MLRATTLVEIGVLPDPGGWQDQAHTFVQAFPIARAELARHREAEMEDARRKAAHKRG
ncbi:MAG: hypothetical protein JNK15_03140 [Planctomycetes bacterium]|nr:hypothetical protein [Planctomycetota bacterium]